jgi:hypothetical protein
VELISNSSNSTLIYTISTKSNYVKFYNITKLETGIQFLHEIISLPFNLLKLKEEIPTQIHSNNSYDYE